MPDAQLRLICFRFFRGVERLSPEQISGGYDYSGEYAAPQMLVRQNITRFGDPEVCSFFAGWFAETLAVRPIEARIRLVYIDCDIAKGTCEVLKGTMAALVSDGSIFSQDYHIGPVRRLLEGHDLWAQFSRGSPTMHRLTERLAVLSFEDKNGARALNAP